MAAVPPPLSLDAWRALGTRRRVLQRTLFVVDRGPLEASALSAPRLPLLLLHGFPTSAYDWAPILDGLAADRRVIAFDLLGYGLSDKPRPHPYSLLEHADYAGALLRDLGIAAAHLVAHDMGDTVVQELLGRRIDSPRLVPFEIASVTLLNGGILVDRTRPIASQRLLRLPLVGELIGRLPSAIARLTFDASMRRIAGPDRPPPREELDVQFRLVEAEGGQRLLPALIGYMKEREVHRLRWRRALLTHPWPMRLLWGDADPINPYSVVEEIVGERPGTEAVRLARVGHYPQLEAPAAVTAAVREFVARHDTPAR